MLGLRRVARTGLEVSDRVPTRMGVHESAVNLAEQSQAYWNTGGDRWANDSHIKSGSQFAGSELWWKIGREHLALFDTMAGAFRADQPWSCVAEWGCGGGANAVHFAPRTRRYVGVDVSPAALKECQQQLRAVTDTEFVPVLAQVADPQSAAAIISTGCDLFLCTYVFELIPSPEYGLEIPRIARSLLAPHGLALIQIKYSDGSRRTRRFGGTTAATQRA